MEDKKLKEHVSGFIMYIINSQFKEGSIKGYINQVTRNSVHADKIILLDNFLIEIREYLKQNKYRKYISYKYNDNDEYFKIKEEHLEGLEKYNGDIELYDYSLDQEKKLIEAERINKENNQTKRENWALYLAAFGLIIQAIVSSCELCSTKQQLELSKKQYELDLKHFNLEHNQINKSQSK